MMYFRRVVFDPMPMGMHSATSALLDGGVAPDQGAEAHHGACHGGPVADHAAVADHGALHVALDQLARGQEAGHRVDGVVLVVEAEGGVRGVTERQVGLVEGLDRPDVLPVAVEEVRLHLHPHAVGPGDDLAPEVVRGGEGLREELDHLARVEHVDAH